MKKLLFFFALVAGLCSFSYTTNAQGILSKVKQKTKDKVNQRADDKIDKTIDKTLDEAENTTKGDGNSEDKGKEKEKVKVEEKTKEPETVSKNADSNPAIKTYNNYDFVPGDKILFEDHFTDDQDGEFATHWELKAGQAVLNKNNGELAMNLTDGNYARVSPRMKTEKYLSDPFTIEYDYYHVPGAYGVVTMLTGYDKQLAFDRESNLYVNENSADFSGASGGAELSKDFPKELAEDFDNKWHHVAIAVKNHQLKVYVDQYRVLVVPDTKEDYDKLVFGGIGAQEQPVIFKNVRIASGGNMNMIGKKFTESKIVTHGINFDIDKATIRPESMGTLNMIVQVMKDNPDLKFEVDGHTDNSGAAQHNQSLSQQRAASVKEQLVKMGIDASRLTTKGLGDTKPISDNTSLEGKANNRRVEFVKL
ncbi:MAG: OmpA family protein [Flavisolibacter sp.]